MQSDPAAPDYVGANGPPALAAEVTAIIWALMWTMQLDLPNQGPLAPNIGIGADCIAARRCVTGSARWQWVKTSSS